MVCVMNDQPKEGTNAFTEESYHKQSGSSSVGGELARRSEAVKGSWLALHGYSRNEPYYGKTRQGTKHFHAYASACIVECGLRYIVALTWVRRHESMVKVIERLLAQIDKIGLKIRCLLLDCAFFNVPVAELLQQKRLPFLMPAMFRGRCPKRPAKTGLHWIKRQSAGWYKHVLKNGKKQVPISVCVGYRRHRNRKDRKQVKQKLLFGAWRISGSPTESRERYRKRFGIETSYRQLRQARIYTCVKDPHLRLLFVAVALILRQPLDLGSRNAFGRRRRREQDPPPRTSAFQTHARLASACGRCPTSRWGNALRRC